MKRKKDVQEIIGRSTSVTTYAQDLYPIQPTVDRTRPDYSFWARLRRGKAEGYRIGGLFAPAIAQVVQSFTLGNGFIAKIGEDEESSIELNRFLDENKTLINTSYFDSLTLGDGWLGVNPDLTMTAASPNQLTIETDRLDWRKVDSYTVVSVIDQPLRFVDELGRTDFQRLLTMGGGDITIRDQFRVDKRLVSIQHGGLDPIVEEFPNPINMLPLVHFPFGRETNETMGHPIFEKLLYLFARYDTAINKSLDAVEIMGNPYLAAVGLENPEESKKANATSTEIVTEKDGDTRTEHYIDMNTNEMFWLGKGADLKFVSPGIGFTSDTARMLELLFLMMLQSILIPEHVWGGAIASSRASVDSQMPTFMRTVTGWQTGISVYLQQLCEIWRAWASLSDPSINTTDPISIEFPPVNPKEAQLLLNQLKLARDEGLITKETTLKKLDLVDDEKEEVQAAKSEALEGQEAFDKSIDDSIERELARDEDAENEENKTVVVPVGRSGGNA